MLNRVVRICAELVHPICVVGSPAQYLPPLPDSVLVAHDEVAGDGPLRGLAAGLTTLRGRCAAVFVCSCDAPLLQPGLIRYLVTLLEDHDVVVPEADGRRHPLLAVYRMTVQPKVHRLLRQRRLSMQGLLDLCDVRVVKENILKTIDPSLASLRNVNTPEAYDRIRTEFGPTFVGFDVASKYLNERKGMWRRASNE